MVRLHTYIRSFSEGRGDGEGVGMEREDMQPAQRGPLFWAWQ